MAARNIADVQERVELVKTKNSILQLDNQIKNKMEYERVFLNSPTSITILYEKTPGVLVSETMYTYGNQDIEFVLGGNEKYITWNSYKPDPDSVWDVKVFIPDIQNIEAGEHDKGKFGKDKLKEL